MSIIRVEKTKNYTVMSNYHFKEKDMSLKAKGLLSLMLSLPNDWDYSIAGLVAICKENETSIKSALNELKEFGYLEVVKKMPNQTTTGRIEYEYIVYEQKKVKIKEMSVNVGEELLQEIEKLWVENQGVENPIQYNNKQSITKKENINNIKESVKEIFDFWNLQDIIKHKELTDNIVKVIDKTLKEYSVEQIKEYIERYAKVIKSQDYFFKTKWTLIEFLKQKNAMPDFKDDGSKWINFKNRPKKYQTFGNERQYTKEQIDKITNDFDNMDNWDI